MSILQNLKNIFKSEEINKSNKSYEFSSYNSNYPSTSKRELLNSMTGWTFSAVSAIADEVASIDLKLYQQNDDGSVEEIKEHRILDVLYKVNSYTTKFDHLWLTQACLELAGEAPWLIERDTFGEPDSIYLLRPDLITPIADNNKIIAGYNYRTDASGQSSTLGTRDVLFLKYPSPLNPFRGSGTLQAAARTVDIDDASEKWNLKFFENSARPDAVLTIPGLDQMSAEQKKALKDSIKEKYQGTEKAHNLMVLFGDMKLDKFGFNASEMDFLEQQKFGRDKILGIFRVPKAIVAQTDGVNFASAKAAQYTFTRFTINPKEERIIQQLNEFFIPMFKNSENLFLDFASPIIDDETEKINKYTSAINTGWMTRNEVRYLENLPPIEGGDYIYLPMGIYPAGSIDEAMPLTSPNSTPDYNVDSTQVQNGIKNYIKLESKILPNNQRFNSERLKYLNARNSSKKSSDDLKKQVKDVEVAVRNMVKGKIKNKVKAEILKRKQIRSMVANSMIEIKKDISDKVYSTEDKKNFWVVKNFFFEKYVNEVKKIANEIFIKQEEKVMDKLSSQKNFDLEKDLKSPYSVKAINTKKVLLNKKTEADLAVTLYSETFIKLFQESGDATFKLLDVPMEMDTSRKGIKKMIEFGIRRLSNSATDTTNKYIEDAITTGISNNEGPADISKRINNVFNDAQNTRSDLIARTETARYNTNASEQAFVDSGVVVEKEWLSEPDACAECAELNGKTIELDTVFLDKGDSINDVTYDYLATQNPPLHPNCFIDHQIPIYTSKGWKKIRDIVIGDLVLTHKGRFKKVTKIIRTPKQTPDVTTLNIEIGGYKNVTDDLTMTNEHPVLVNNKWVYAKDIKIGDNVHILASHCKYCDSLVPYLRSFCNHTCQSKLTTKVQWSKDSHRQLISKATTKRLKKEWSGDMREKRLEQLSNARKNITICPLTLPENRIKGQQSCGRRNYGKTWIEEKVGYEMNKRGIEFEKQYPIIQSKKDSLGMDRYYFADFKIKNHNILIECDGEYWHSSDKSKKRDSDRQKEIESKGFMVLRFNSSEILKNIQPIVDEIERVLMNHNHKYEFVTAKVKSIKNWKVSKPRTLYNFSVDGDESYLAKGIVVHNCKCDILPVIKK